MAATAFSPVFGSCIRTSPLRVVYSTRRSGRTTTSIGSPGPSSSVTFWKLESGGGSATWATDGVTDNPPSATCIPRGMDLEADLSEELVADPGRVQGLGGVRGGEPASSRSTMYSTAPAFLWEGKGSVLEYTSRLWQISKGSDGDGKETETGVCGSDLPRAQPGQLPQRSSLTRGARSYLRRHFLRYVESASGSSTRM